MKEEHFDELMRDAAHTYNRPPAEPPFDAMWDSIERSRRRQQWVAQDETHMRLHSEPAKRAWYQQPWLRTAAILAVGIGLGRASVAVMSGPAELAPTAQAEPDSKIPAQYHAATDQYLGQAAALLIALPAELDAQRADRGFITRADDLLLQTRLLLDSPATADPALRTLFEDLEMVLVQVVRLQADRDPARVELLQDALKQGDVLPRLRNAVVDHIAD